MVTDALRVGVIGGAGWLGSAIIGALLKASIFQPSQICVSYRRSKPALLEGVYLTQDNRDLLARSDVIILSVRPDDWRDLELDCDGKLVISVMAGVSIEQLKSRHNTKRVVRCLPNAAVEVGHSYTPWISVPDLNADDRSLCRLIFSACGSQDEFETEQDIDYLGVLTGTGPAFPALLASAMMKDAVARGMSTDIARRAINSVFVGAGRFLEKHDQCPLETVEAFHRYHGLTSAAMKAMETNGFDDCVSNGLAAGLKMSEDMSRS